MGDIAGAARNLRRLALVLLTLAACAPPAPAEPGADAIAAAAAAAPEDARLAALYNRSCRTCHTAAGMGAPLTHDRTAWDERWAKGEDALVQSTIAGLNGMPPGGQCFSCTPQDYRALIRFMAGREGR